MKIKFAKNVMENEEGINHLLIKIPSDPLNNLKKVTIELPDGIYRNRNLNGLEETDEGTILLNNNLSELEIVTEIFTQNPIPYGEREILIWFYFRDEQSHKKGICYTLPISIVKEEEMGDLEIDYEVVIRVKELLTGGKHEGNDDLVKDFVLIPPTHNIPSCVSELEKKYRVEFI